MRLFTCLYKQDKEQTKPTPQDSPITASPPLTPEFIARMDARKKEQQQIDWVPMPSLNRKS